MVAKSKIRLLFLSLPLTFSLILVALYPKDCSGYCKYAHKKDNYIKFSNETQSIPNLAAAAIALYKKDFEGVSSLIAMNSMRTLSKTGIKRMGNRTRPCGCKGGSFPSGHALATFQGASYVQYRYGFKYAIPVYAVALATSYGRVKSKSHYWTDIIGSAVIVNLLAYLTVSPHENSSVRLIPVVNPEAREIMFGIKYNF